MKIDRIACIYRIKNLLIKEDKAFFGQIDYIHKLSDKELLFLLEYFKIEVAADFRELSEEDKKMGFKKDIAKKLSKTKKRKISKDKAHRIKDAFKFANMKEDK